MARTASGKEVLAKAREVETKAARTVEELRQVQSVICPRNLVYGTGSELFAVTSKGWAVNCGAVLSAPEAGLNRLHGNERDRCGRI